LARAWIKACSKWIKAREMPVEQVWRLFVVR
jgi:hypothetical protein